MATNAGDCHNDPNFAVICSFLDRYSETLALPAISYAELESWILDTKRVNPNLIDLHIRMLRRTGKKSCSNVTVDRWEKALVKFCHTYSDVDAWEIERFSYKYCKISTKLKLLKNLLECQFDTNIKFKDKINELLPEDMRFLPVGRDKHGLAYWFMIDKSLNLRIYREDMDDVDSETWELVCRDRDDLAKLIQDLEKGDNPKLEKSDLSDASFKSEPVSDFNEDSRDSFTHSRSCTPVKPSPLTIKSEPPEDDSESNVEQKTERLTMKLKIPKLDVDSPRKRLKDKFEKEKGQQIKSKKKCKIKEDEKHRKSSDDNEEENDKSNVLKTNEGNTEISEEKMNGEVDKELEKVEDPVVEKKKNIDEVDGLGNSEKDSEVVNVKEIVNSCKNESTSADDEELNKTDTKTKETVADETTKLKEVDSGVLDKENKNKIIIEETSQHNLKSIDNKDSSEVQDTDAEGAKELEIKIDINKSESPVSRKAENTNSDKIEAEAKDLTADSKTPHSEQPDQENHLHVKNPKNKALDLAGEQNGQILSESIEDKAVVCDKQTSDTMAHTKNSSHVSYVNGDEEVLKKVLVEGDTSVISQEREESTENKTLEESKEEDVHCKSESPLTSQESEHKCSDAKKDNGITFQKPADEKEGSVDVVCGKMGEKSPNEQEILQEKDLPKSESVLPNSYDTESQTKVSEKSCNEATEESTADQQTGCVSSVDSETKYSGEMDKENIESRKDLINTDSHKDDKNKIETAMGDKISSEGVTAALIKNSSELTDSEEKGELVEKSNDEIKHKDDNESNSEDGIKCKDDKESNAETDQKPEKVTEDIVKETTGKHSKMKENMLGENEDNSKSDSETKDLIHGKTRNSVLGTEKGAGEATDLVKQSELDVASSPKRQTKVAVRKLTKKTVDKAAEQPEEDHRIKEDKSDKESSTESSEEDSTSSDSSEKVPLTKMKGLLAHSRLNKGKALKRQAEDSVEDSPVEPASKRSKVRGRVTSKTRSKPQAEMSDTSESSSSSDSDDVPLSQITNKSGGKGKKAQKPPLPKKQTQQQPSRKSSRPVKKKKTSSDAEYKSKAEKSKGGKSKEDKPPEDSESNLSEKESGRRRSARVRSLRARKKKEPSPDYIPSELEEFISELDSEDDEFVVKSKRRKKKQTEPVEEVPKGRNAQRLEAKAKTKSKSNKQVEPQEVEEDETPCCKCLKSNQPEWILLCDKCDAGYHTACLRPPLMMIPDGDWFCPPCEHAMLIEKLQENLRTLDQNLLKSDRLVRRKERLAYVGISLDNIIKEEKKEETEENTESESESGSSSSSESTTESSSSESSETRYPRRAKARRERKLEKKERRRERKAEMRQSYIKRSCRSKNPISYKFEEYDELIMDAIQEDMSIPKEPKQKKVKPPGISRGKDMSNILGVSDDEKKQSKALKKRRPRLTELDDTDEGDDDTDDYHVSMESGGTDVSAESESVADSGSDYSDELYQRRRSSRRSSRRIGRESRMTRRSRRKRRGCSKYDDFVVESDYESEEDSGRRPTRKSARKRVNYRELNSDESEVKLDDEESFHTSDLSSDDGKKIKSKSKRDKKRKHHESSEEWTEESGSDAKPSSKKKQSRKKSESDEDSYSEDSESEDELRGTAVRNEKKKVESETESDKETVKLKVKGKKKKAVIESESESESEEHLDDKTVDKEENVEETGENKTDTNTELKEKNEEETVESHEKENTQDEGSETEVSEGDWEEIDAGSGSDKGEQLKSPKRKASPIRDDTLPKKGLSSPKREPPVKKTSPQKKGINLQNKGGRKGPSSPKRVLSPPLQSHKKPAIICEETEHVADKTDIEDGAQGSTKPQPAVKNIRKRKSTDTSDTVAKASEIKPQPETGSTESEMGANVEKEMEEVCDTSGDQIETCVSDTSSLNLSHIEDLDKSEELEKMGLDQELNDSKQEISSEDIPLKKKRTRRTKAQMEEFRKAEEVEIQKMIAQGIPEDVARRRRKSLHKRARARSLSMEKAQLSGGMSESIDFLSEENIHIASNAAPVTDIDRTQSVDSNINVASDNQIQSFTEMISEMKPVEKSLTNVKQEQMSDEDAEKPEKVSENDSGKPESDKQKDDLSKKEIEKSTDVKSSDERKDDSPLSARRDYNNAPVGIVKPEVRQGVIVENRQVMDSMRGPIGGPSHGGSMVSPLQGMKDMTMGKMSEHGGGFHSPNMPPGYQNRGNTEGFRQPQPHYTGFQPQQGTFGPSQQQPYQQGVPHRPYPYSDQQGPMSPNSYPPSSQYMSPNMSPGPQGYYPGSYRASMGPGIEGPQSSPSGYGGYGPPGNQNYPHQGPYSQGFQPPSGPYQGQMQGPGPYPEQGPMQGPYPGPSGQMNYPQNMPGGYPHVPQPHHLSPHGVPYPQHASPVSPNQPVRPQPIPAAHSGPSRSDSPTARPPVVGVPPRNRRGFMMDNILKPTSAGSREEDNGDEMNDIVNYVANDEYFKEH